MNFITISSILIVVSNIIMAFILFLTSKRRKPNLVWAWFCIFAAIWGAGGIIWSSTKDIYVAHIGWQIANVGAAIAPVIFCHFILEYLNKVRLLELLILYGVAFIFLFLNLFFKEKYYGDLNFVFNQFYYLDWLPRRNAAYLIFYISFYWGLLTYGFAHAVISFLKSTGVKRNQLKYFIIGMMVGFLGAHGCFPLVFGYRYYPYLDILIGIYPIIIGYAIVRYRLMDISVVITRFTIFVAVYSLVLGIPFVMAFGWRGRLERLFGENWWMVPLLTSTVFSILGPRIYLYFQKRAEDRLLQEQRQYQDTMRKASLGMGRIKDLKRLLNLIVHVVTRTVRIEHCEIFLLNKEKDTYELKAVKSLKKHFVLGSTIPINSPVIQYLKFLKEPILAEDIEQRSENTSDRQIENIQKILKELDAEIIVPSFIDQRLISLIVFGKKRSGKSYSQDDLVVFSILANQSGLAIENALFYEDVKKKNEQLFKAEKMATIGTMADGLSHQINNRLHAMGFISGDALDSLDIGKKEESAPEIIELFNELEHAFIRIQKNVTQGGEVVEGLLKWTRKTDEGYGPIEMNEIFEASLEMIKFKIKLDEVVVSRKLSDVLPRVKGNFSQLQEVFFNIIDNSYDSMMQRKQDLNEPDYNPVLEITAVHKGSHLEVVVRDNGMGVKPSDVNKLFTPFFTTKISSRKGTGLGLYVIRQIIEKNHAGRVEFTSDYHKGAQTKVLLPIAVSSS